MKPRKADEFLHALGEWVDARARVAAFAFMPGDQYDRYDVMEANRREKYERERAAILLEALIESPPAQDSQK